MDYKDTLNLPNTDFPMKANLTEREPKALKLWDELGLYRKMEEKNAGKVEYILHDGPPYANGNIHIGHALNKILKDIIVKYRSLKGYYSPYVPGWDCHGLPIELQVDKELGKKKAETGIIEKRRLCREYAKRYIDIQREEFKRLGVIGDWEQPYITMEYEYEAAILREFFNFYETGGVYRGKKPVHWCPSCVTALAEAEVEYADKKSPSIYVKFRVDSPDSHRLLPENNLPLYIIIWTTTPWTLPANMALAVNPQVDYSIVIDAERGEGYIAASSLLSRLSETIGLSGSEIKKVRGENLIFVTTKHPFIDRISRVISADFVSTEDGTGVVHIAPGHGEDDYHAGLKNGLDLYAPVDDHGRFTPDVPELNGMNVYDANGEVIRILTDKNALIKEGTISHSYPHCWRCKKPVIFRATEQWFISMETAGLKERCLGQIDEVKWEPSWGKDRILSMMKNRPDWCISRQRSWGVPIAVFLCKGCKEPVSDRMIFDRTIDLFKEKGADAWFDVNAAEILDNGYRCKKCGATEFDKETDILDVWFDSGASHAAADKRLKFPAQLYLEGSDQHRGWFQSSLIISTAIRKTAPFQTVLTHGFVVDGKGKKMSKSIGNVISPQEIIKKNGADILRLWVAAEDYRNDIRISTEIIARLTEAYRKIRNTCRFLLGNLSDFDNKDYSGSLLEIDRYAMSRLMGLIERIDRAYKAFDFHEVFHGLYNYCIVELSSFYLDILKDRLYTFAADSKERRAAQWTMKKILDALVVMMSPVLSFTAEEVYLSMGQDEVVSVFLADFPKVDEKYLDKALEDKWLDLKLLRRAVNKKIELKREKKEIGNSLEAEVILSILTSEDENIYKYLNDKLNLLSSLFIVSQVTVEGIDMNENIEFNDGNKNENISGFDMDKFLDDELEAILTEDELIKATESNILDSILSIRISKAQGAKCERCWNISPSVGTHSAHPDVCSRCHDVLNA